MTRLSVAVASVPTRALLAAAVLATALDGIAYAALISAGKAAERNPLFVGATVPLALAAKGALCVLLLALVAVIGARARWALCVAIAVGLAGFATTVAAAA